MVYSGGYIGGHGGVQWWLQWGHGGVQWWLQWGHGGGYPDPYHGAVPLIDPPRRTPYPGTPTPRTTTTVYTSRVHARAGTPPDTARTGSFDEINAQRVL